MSVTPCDANNAAESADLKITTASEQDFVRDEDTQVTER